MKSYLIRPAGVLAMALGLASCGGGGDDDSYTVAGTVEGLQYPGLVLTTNGGDLPVSPPAKAGDAVNFVFPKRLEYGDEFKVTVKTQPAHQFCQAPEETGYFRTTYGTAGQLAQINARFACTVNAYPIGGKVTGLTKDNKGLVLANGSTTGSTAIIAAETNTTGAAFDYQMILAVPYGQTYGVVVVTQPTGAFCTVANPAGTMGDAAVTNININCVPR